MAWVRAPRILQKAAVESRWFTIGATSAFLAEIAVSVAIISFVPYTEIDWVAYMQEVGGFLNGTWDYTQLQGDTGPLVYPAGFVYIYSALYYATGGGESIRRAQGIFAVIYLLHIAIVLGLYCRVAKSLQLPPWLLVFLCFTAYRVHSIFLLRLFNDPIAVLLLYIALHLLISHHWKLACFTYSLAVSVKMNILLFAPGLLVLLLRTHGWAGTLPLLALCALTQVLLGAPFLMVNATGYISRSFDFGRQFFFKWTVNWRFLPEWLFLHHFFHIVLLAAHVSVVIAFTVQHWVGRCGTGMLLRWRSSERLSGDVILWVMFSSNFIGMVFARSLHYQFYVWYFHSLPLLLHTSRLPSILCVVLFLMLEWCWNVYPSTVASSLVLHTAHAIILTALWRAGPPAVPSKTD